MEFFNGDGVNYKFSHDSIHESVKMFDRPAYSYFQSENAEVMCDMNKFLNLPLEIQLAAGYEESCVLALERSIIPFNTDYHKAFLMALEKVCTSISSGKFRNFCWEHYIQIRDMYNEETFTKFFADADAGKVELHT